MSRRDNHLPRADGAGATLRLVLTVAALAAALGATVFGVHSLAGHERDRAMQAWRTQLGLIAETRREAVDHWIEAQYGELTALADNAALQFYAGVLAQRGAAAAADVAPEAEYLRNLFALAAHRGGFAAAPAGPQVDANVRRVGIAGIALIDGAGHVLAATAGMPGMDSRLMTLLRGAAPGERAMTEIFTNGAGNAAMAFSVPVVAAPQDQPTAAPAARLVGVKEVGAELAPLMRQPGMIWRSAEAVLVRGAGRNIEYLTSLRGSEDGTAPRSAPFDLPESAAAFAITEPGQLALRRDWRGEAVLVTGRPVPATSWTLMVKIDRDEALAASDARTAQMMVGALAIAGVIVLGGVALWRHGASRRASRAVQRLRRLTQRFAEQERLLRLVTDSQPNAMYIVDADGRCRFANRALAQLVGSPPAAMVGKPLVNLLGPAAARQSAALSARARKSGGMVCDVSAVEIDSASRTIQSTHIPIPGEAIASGAVLVIDQDITVAVHERERRTRTLNQLVRTLVMVVDRRDPFAADHSARVALVARAVAEEMGIEPTLVATVEVVGQIMNIGKILVPHELLTRTGELSPDEIRRVRDGIRASADLIAGVEFDGPVVETLQQLGERWDGTGPAGLKGEAILVTARVVAVANAYIAMTSERAYRPGCSPDDAIEMLMADAGKAFDRRVVAALINRFDNRGGRTQWANTFAAAG